MFSLIILNREFVGLISSYINAISLETLSKGMLTLLFTSMFSFLVLFCFYESCLSMNLK